MPGMGGEELAEIAVTLRPGIRVVFTSGFQTPPGNAAFVPKPYRAVDLIRVLPPQPLPSLDPNRGVNLSRIAAVAREPGEAPVGYGADAFVPSSRSNPDTGYGVGFSVPDAAFSSVYE
jgi:hypothetical protein